MNGIFNLIKPSGVTSRRIVDIIIKASGQSKAGHAGTLDPFASGVLPVCVGQATKLVDFIVEGSKEYHGTLMLGVETDTQDSTGRIIREQHIPKPWTLEFLQGVAERFIGPIVQKTPQYSARKYKGRRLYSLAREGESIPDIFRQVSIHRLRIVCYFHPFVEFEVECSKGTYIRTLASDMGSWIGCGAVLCRLCRTRVGRFILEEAVHLAELQCGSDVSRYLAPLESAVSWMNQMVLSSRGASRFVHGSEIRPDDIQTIRQVNVDDSRFAVFSEKDQLIGLGHRVLLPGGSNYTLKSLRVLDIRN